MHYSHPPMFSNDGYHPSIFMDISPMAFHEPTRDLHAGLTYNCSARERYSETQRSVDYIQIWLNSHSRDTGPHSVIDAIPGYPPSPALVLDATQNTFDASRLLVLEPDVEMMEWEGYQSSPRLRSTLSADEGPAMPCSDPFVLSQTTDPVLVSTQKLTVISLARQCYAMLPHLPSQSRSRCIFLAPTSSANRRMHRRVQDLLHNTSIQRIRTWFHDTIEPFALEQWRNISYFNHLNRLGATAASGDGHALEHQGSAATSVEECPICFRSRVIMKRIYPCDHFVCWKCEQQLDRAGNISCPICRGLRFYASYISVVDLFKTTIGLLPRDYTHPHLASLLEPTATDLDRDAMDDAEEIEHELTDRYIWEQSESFLEHVHVSAKRYPVTQYFQLNAAHDHCFKPSREHLLPEYNDQSVFDPPTSGLVLPPHRLYIALIHVCLDMLTLPDPATFQYCQLKPAPFKREVMLIELVALFLIPTDEFSPRGPGRIYNTAAWIEHGQYILARIYYFLKAKVCRFKWELDGEDILPLAGHQQHQQNHEQALGPSSIGVPSAPLPRSILYLGTERWMWVVRSLTVLLTWLQAARTNPSMAMPEVCMQPKESLLGKHELQQDEDENPRPVKRQRMWRRAQ